MMPDALRRGEAVSYVYDGQVQSALYTGLSCRQARPCFLQLPGLKLVFPGRYERMANRSTEVPALPLELLDYIILKKEDGSICWAFKGLKARNTWYNVFVKGTTTDGRRNQRVLIGKDIESGPEGAILYDLALRRRGAAHEELNFKSEAKRQQVAELLGLTIAAIDAKILTEALSGLESIKGFSLPSVDPLGPAHTQSMPGVGRQQPSHDAVGYPPAKRQAYTNPAYDRRASTHSPAPLHQHTAPSRFGTPPGPRHTAAVLPADSLVHAGEKSQCLTAPSPAPRASRRRRRLAPNPAAAVPAPPPPKAAPTPPQAAATTPASTSARAAASARPPAPTRASPPPAARLGSVAGAAPFARAVAAAPGSAVGRGALSRAMLHTASTSKAVTAGVARSNHSSLNPQQPAAGASTRAQGSGTTFDPLRDWMHLVQDMGVELSVKWAMGSAPSELMLCELVASGGQGVVWKVQPADSTSSTAATGSTCKIYALKVPKLVCRTNASSSKQQVGTEPGSRPALKAVSNTGSAAGSTSNAAYHQQRSGSQHQGAGPRGDNSAATEEEEGEIPSTDVPPVHPAAHSKEPSTQQQQQQQQESQSTGETLARLESQLQGQLHDLADEFQLLQQAESDYVVSVLAVGVIPTRSQDIEAPEVITQLRKPGVPCMLLEFAQHGTLADLAKKRYDIYGLLGMTQQQARSVSWQIAKGVQHLHRLCVVHRDLKPDNILVSDPESGPPEEPLRHPDKLVHKIADFGVARTTNGFGNYAETYAGTPGVYMAQEVRELRNAERGTKHYGPEVDVCSLGMIWLAVRFGYHAFWYVDNGSPDNMRRWAAEELDNPFCPYNLDKGWAGGPLSDLEKDWVSKCIAWDMQERWSIDRLLEHPYFADSDS